MRVAFNPLAETFSSAKDCIQLCKLIEQTTGNISMCDAVIEKGIELGLIGLEETAKLYKQMFWLVYERDFSLRDLAEMQRIQE